MEILMPQSPIKKYRISKQSVFDTILTAMMIEHKISSIITFNEKHFKDFREINVVNPQKTPNFF